MKKWKIVVDPEKSKNGSTTFGFMKEKNLKDVKVFFDRNDNIIYVSTPIEKTSVRTKLIQYATNRS